MTEAFKIEKKHTSRYQSEKLGLEENVAESNAIIKTFEELEQPAAALKMSFAPRENAFFGKTLQADSYWDVLRENAFFGKTLQADSYWDVLLDRPF